MKNNKTTIHEFDPCVYPRLLWVVKGGTLEEIRKTLEFAELDDSDATGAVTVGAYDNAKKKGGFLVWFPRPSDMTKHGFWMAHEAAHVALGIYSYVGAEAKAEDSEPFAYLVGWAFECMDKVRKYKEVKNVSDTSEQECSKEVELEKACEEKEDARRG